MTDTTKSLLLLLLGLILGFLIGHFALPPECQPEGPGSRGELFLPPSQMPTVLGIPEGTWPKVDCAGQQALMMLDDVFALLVQAEQSQPPRIDPFWFAQVLAEIYNTAEMPDNPAQHAAWCKAVKKARDAVQAILDGEPGPNEMQWAAVIDDLPYDN